MILTLQTQYSDDIDSTNTVYSDDIDSTNTV